MKRTLLLLITILAFSPFLWSQETVECYPASGDYNTGSTNGTEFTQTSLIKTAAGLVEAGWARFDLSTVPANAPIQSVELHIYVAVDNNAYWQVMSMEEDPLLGTAESVFTDCTSGDIYANWNGADFPEPDWFIADLGEEAVSDLNSQLADGWFGISMWEYETGGIYAIECEGWDETNPPYIVVTYLPVGTVFPPYDPDPANGAFEVGLESDLNWTFGANTENYDLYFGADNPPTTKVIDNEASGTTGMYDPGTLEYITTYYWQVISRNSTTEVAGPIWSFASECGSSTVPITENFEDVLPPELPYCWFGLVNSTSTFSYVQTLGYNGIDNSNCVALYNSDDPSPSLLFISPQIEDGVAGKYVNFFAWGYDGPLSIGTISDPSDESTFNEIATVTLTGMYQDYQEFETFFTNYTGTDSYIAFKANPTFTYGGTYIDNILIDFAPTCPKPTGLYTSETTLNTATIGWMENGEATQWNIEYGLVGFTPTGVANATATTNPFILTDLLSSSTYDFYVQADCGGGEVSYWHGPAQFNTLCDVSPVPFSQDFEAVTPPELPNCWDALVNSISPYAYVQTLTYNGIENSQSVAFENSDDPSATLLFISPQIEGGVAGKYANFFAWGYAPTLSVGTITDPMDELTYTEMATVTLSNIYQDYQEFEVFFTDYTGTDNYIAFRLYPSGMYQGSYIDNILIDVAPTCPKPTDPYTDGTTLNSATLGWTENGEATQWNIEYGPYGFTPTGVGNATATTNPFELTGLESSTFYEYYVQADCGGGELSYWVGPTTFKTLCEATTVPYFEGFEDAPMPDVPPCIIVENTNDDDKFWYTDITEPYEGEKTIRINYNYAMAMDDWFFSPPLDLVGGETYIVQFYYTSNSSSYIEQLEVMWGTGSVSTAMTNGPIFEDLGINYAYVYHEGEGYFTPETDGVYFVGWHGFSIANQYNIFIDNITIDVAPTCVKPTMVFASSPTNSSAFINWTENGSATQWNIEYVYTGETPTGVPNETVGTNPYELTGLEAGTTYDCYVQADCGGGDLSWWSQPVTFTTLCDDIVVPYFEDVSNVTVPEIPDCWLQYETTTGMWNGVTTLDYNYLSAPYCFGISNGNNLDAEVILISPPIADDDGAAGKYISFFAMGFNNNELTVGTIADPFDGSTFNEITNITTSDMYEEYEVFFNNYTGTDNFIAIKGVFNNTYQNVYIDDITIDHPPTCPKPNELFAGATTPTTAMLNWTENGEATMWNIEYVYAGETPTGVPTISVTENPYELTGLEDGTAYEFYVQADCGGGDVSYWYGPAYFQTQCYPATLPYFEDFEEGVFPPTLPVCMTYDDSNNDGVTWQSSNNLPYSGVFHMMVGYTFSQDMNDWFFSAPIELLGGQTYNLVFYYTTNTNNYQENLEVKFGTEPTGEGMTSEAIFFDEMFAYNNEYQEAAVQFSPAEDGLYYLGWHCYSISGQWDTYIDDIYVEWDNSLIVTATATPDEICEGDESVLNGSGIGGTGNYTYSWTSDPEGFTSNEADPTVMPDVTTDYILELNDGMISMYDTVTVVVHDYPGAPGAPVGIGYMCANIANTTYSSSGASGAGSYHWVLDPPEAGNVSGTSTSISVSWDVNFVGSISLTVAGVNNGCEGPASNPLSIIRYLPDVTLEPFDLVEHDWPAFELTGGTPEGGEYSGAGCVDGWFHPDVAGLGDHTITYTYSDVSLCENSADQVLTVVLDIGINEQHNLKVNISPNPSNGVFNLNVNSSSRKAVNIMVVNNYGKEVFEISNAKLNETYSTEIDLSNYAKGLYYIKIYSDDIYYVEKVIIK